MSQEFVPHYLTKAPRRQYWGGASRGVVTLPSLKTKLEERYPGMPFQEAYATYKEDLQVMKDLKKEQQ